MSSFYDAATLDDLEEGHLARWGDGPTVAISPVGMRMRYANHQGYLGPARLVRDIDWARILPPTDDQTEGFVPVEVPETKRYSESAIREAYRLLGTPEEDLNKLFKVLDWASAAEKLG